MVNAITLDGVGTLQSRRVNKVTRHGIIAAGFIACAMVLGGGGSPSPVTELALQVLFAFAALAWIWWARGEGAKVPSPLLWLGGALLLLPALQLMPLPPAIWQALPERELLADTLALVEQDRQWRALSISPPLTIAGLLAVIPAVGTMWAISTLGSDDRALVLATIALLALAAAVLGALQLATGPEAFRLYERSHRGWLTAFHANRNAAADVFIIGSLAASSWIATRAQNSERGNRAMLLLGAFQFVLLVALVLTGSRAGIVLGMLCVAIHLAIWRPKVLDLRTGGVVAGMGAIVLTMVALPVLLSGNGRIARVTERFDARDDARLTLWQDAWQALAGYWPFGSGVGTFANAFQPFESLAYLDGAFVNRAHNDYMEFALEGGLLAIGLLIAGLAILVMMARKAWRVSPQHHAIQLFALGTLGVIALHSLVDYPLRNMAIACLAGAAAGLLTVTPGRKSARGGQERRDNAK